MSGYYYYWSNQHRLPLTAVGSSVCREWCRPTLKHASVIEPDILVISPHGHQLRSEWVHTQTLGLSVRAQMYVEINEYITWGLACLWVTQVKLPAFTDDKTISKAWTILRLKYFRTVKKDHKSSNYAIMQHIKLVLLHLISIFVLL